jgi:preprotein translocase subunit SecG
MIILLTIIHVLVCFFLVVVVLLQSGKAADLAGAFGGMGSQTAFGPRGAATILTRATTIAAGLFMLTSLVLSINASRMGKTGSTVLEGVAPKQTQQKGATGQQPVQLPIPVSTEGGQTTTSPVPAPPAAPAGKQPGGTPATPPAEPAKK